MTTLSTFFNTVTRKKNRILQSLCLCFAFLFLGCFSACKKSVDYEKYISELRSNIFLAKTEDFSLRIFSVRKEIPYVADGIPQESTERTEVYLTARDGSKPCHVTFDINGVTYGGDMSFDNVKTEYYFSCTLDTSAESELACHIRYGEEELTLTALSVKTADTLSPQQVLKNLQGAEAELFTSLTDKYGFAGEIYLRLLFEDVAYYYVGVIDRKGEVTAFLINATTGKILAKRKA